MDPLFDAGAALQRELGWEPTTVARAARAMAEGGYRTRLALEVVEEWWQIPIALRRLLVIDEPPSSGATQWDALLAGLAERLAIASGDQIPQWARTRRPLEREWAPIDWRPLLWERARRDPHPVFLNRGVVFSEHDLSRDGRRLPGAGAALAVP